MASTTETWEEYLYKQVLEGLQSISPQEATDTYAVSFYVWADEDDPRRMVLSVSYNTNTRVAACTPKAADGSDVGWSIASSASEATWNYAFWLQREVATLCGSAGQTECLLLRAAWVEATGLGYTDEEEEENFERTLELGEKICLQFWQMAGRVARRLQQENKVESIFGHRVPIIVHDLEYGDPTQEMTRFANPLGEADAFLQADW